MLQARSMWNTLLLSNSIFHFFIIFSDTSSPQEDMRRNLWEHFQSTNRDDCFQINTFSSSVRKRTIHGNISAWSCPVTLLSCKIGFGIPRFFLVIVPTISIHNCSVTFHNYCLQNPCWKFFIENKPIVRFMKLKCWKSI
jgi:hypothetical protein